MIWEKVGARNLRLVQITQEEKEQLNKLLTAMSNRLSDAKTIASRLRRDVLERGMLENYKLDRTETLAQLSTWCHAVGKYTRVKPLAEEVSKLLFAGHVLPRLVAKNSKPVHNAVQLLDEFIDKVMRDQRDFIYPGQGATSADDDIVQTEEETQDGPPTTLSVEKDLRKYIAFNPSVVEQGLKLISEEYSVADAGRIDVLCEDSEGNLVVIELKKDRSGDKVVGQTLRYMGWLKMNKKPNVRGIIVLGERDINVEYAVESVPNVQIKYYKVRFDITDGPPAEEVSGDDSGVDAL